MWGGGVGCPKWAAELRLIPQASLLGAAHQILLPFSTAWVGTRPQEFKVEGYYWDWHPRLDYNMLFPLCISKSLLLSPENLDELLHR